MNLLGDVHVDTALLCSLRGTIQSLSLCPALLLGALLASGEALRDGRARIGVVRRKLLLDRVDETLVLAVLRLLLLLVLISLAFIEDTKRKRNSPGCSARGRSF